MLQFAVYNDMVDELTCHFIRLFDAQFIQALALWGDLRGHLHCKLNGVADRLAGLVSKQSGRMQNWIGDALDESDCLVLTFDGSFTESSAEAAACAWRASPGQCDMSKWVPLIQIGFNVLPESAMYSECCASVLACKLTRHLSTSTEHFEFPLRPQFSIQDVLALKCFV